MTHTIHTPVLVVGGGPTGLVLAAVVRPGLHIAWSGTSIDDPAAVIARVRGAQ